MGKQLGLWHVSKSHQYKALISEDEEFREESKAKKLKTTFRRYFQKDKMKEVVCEVCRITYKFIREAALSFSHAYYMGEDSSWIPYFAMY